MKQSTYPLAHFHLIRFFFIKKKPKKNEETIHVLDEGDEAIGLSIFFLRKNKIITMSFFNFEI